MPAISRQSAKIFASNAPVGQVTAFRTTETTPQTTKAPDQIQNENYLQGWLNADGSGNVLPYAEDMNGLFYTLSYNTAYLYEKGIPEYSSTQTYYLNSFCQYSGKIYRCKGDSVINIAPTNTNYWDALPSSSYTATTVGAGTTNYGTVYAGTDTAGTQFQFKTIIGGSNVTITETADSLTISSTGGGGGGASFVANSPLSYSNGVLSISAASSSQNGYLSAADWTSFNSKLSSTIFSANNTWTGTNTVRDLIPSANSTYSLGSTTYAWQALYSNYILSNSNDHLAIGSTIDNNRILINYLTSGGNYGVFPDTVGGTSSYLGNSVYKWNYGYIDSIYSNNLHNAAYYFGSTSAGSYSTFVAHNGTNYVDVAFVNYTAAESGLGFFPANPNTGSIGLSGSFWAKGYFKDLYISNGISLSGNITTPSDDTYSVGTYSARLAEIYSRYVFLNQNNGIYADTNTGKFMFQWHSDSANANRTVWFSDDSFIPFVDNQIDLGTTTNGWKKSAFAEIFPNAAVGDLRLDSGNQYYNDGIKIWCETYTNRNWYINAAVMSGGSPVFRPSQNNTIALGDPSHNWANMYSYNIYVGDIYGINGDMALHNGLVPTSDRGASLGWATQRFEDVCARNVKFSSTNYFYQEDSTGNTFFQWKNAFDSQNRTIFFSQNHILPFNADITLGNDYFKWQLIYSTGGVTGSDRDIKRNIENLEDASEKLNQLNIVSYMTKAKDSEIMYGVIAQEAEKVAPEIVRIPEGYKEGDGSLGVYTNNVLFLAVKAIQELSAEVTDLKQQLKELQK